MHETVVPIEDKRIPKGFTVTYHELRGYDSPDRWFEAHRGARKLGDYTRKDEAIEACRKQRRG